MKRGTLALSCAMVLAAAATGIVACGLATSGTAADSAGDASTGPSSTPDASNADGASFADANGFIPNDAGGGVIEAGIDATTTPVPYTTRIASNLIALYELEENAGTKITDKTASPYNLSADDSSKIAWHPHYLEITDFTMLTSSANFDKFATAVSASNAFTVETWVRFGGVDGSSSDSTFGRLISIADGDDDRDVELGDILGGGAPSGDGFMGIVGNGSSLTKGTVPTTLVHLVLTANGPTLTMYLNGAAIGSITDSDQPNNHDDKQPLYVGNDENGDRGVKGDLHLLAFYSVALSASDVAINYAAGADPP